MANLARLYRDGAQQSFSAHESQSRTALDAAMLSMLGTCLSLETHPPPASELPRCDLGQLVLPLQEFPQMCAIPLTVKLGRKLPDVRDPDADFFMDRHRAFCDPVCEILSELHDPWGDIEFPSAIRDIKSIFGTPKKAQQYFRRGWRYLSENKVPRVPADAPLASPSRIFADFLHQELSLPAEATNLNCDACRVFRSLHHDFHDETDTATDFYSDSANEAPKGPSDSVIIILLQGCVVTKVSAD